MTRWSLSCDLPFTSWLAALVVMPRPREQVSLATKLGAGPTDPSRDALRRASAPFALGADHDLGVGAYRGQVPVTNSLVDRAASTIGQGRLLVSPLAIADLAATVARGHHLTPTLLLHPEDVGQHDEVPPLDTATVTALQRLMREVVTSGSGRALADVPGPPVHGKTGTAEYGTGDPPRTHAWFAGYQGDLAVAVLVAETPDSFGGRVAAPVAADLLRRLHR
jgi:cell division protein FtsI/penicillin-binding protein 2